MRTSRIILWPELSGAVINPNIYGHFAEHLGRCIHEGIQVSGKGIPHAGGIRLDVIAALKHLRAPVLRWPGGCFADDYHWRNGIGPKNRRPATTNIWWKQTEPNSFGTDEFMALCHATGAEPYICCNAGSGTPREAREWLEYCNFGGDSTLTRMRAKYGAPEPYNVKYWGVGNESWGCGGAFAPEDYAREYIRFANFLRTLDPNLQLIASGTNYEDYRTPVRNRWNHDFCQAMPHPHLINHIALHRYFKRGTGTGFSDSEYRALFADVLAMERDIDLTEAVLNYFYPDHFVGIIVDEWGMWHPEATTENGLEQQHTLRDALLAASVLNLFNRRADRVTMANLAQTVNVLQCMAMTNGADLFLTPTYHVFDMMRPHMGAALVRQAVECPIYESHAIGFPQKQEVPCLSVSASLSGKKIRLTVVNQALDKDIECQIATREAAISDVSGRELNAEDPREHNSFETPKAVKPARIQADPVKGALTYTFPAHSFTAFSLTLE
jgi:alpha-L-arabinofuranosidase